MAARARRAVGDQRANEGAGAGLDGQGDAMPRDAFDRDALADARAFDMRQARGAPVRFVQMNVAFDKGGREQGAAQVDDFTAPPRLSRAPDRGDPAFGDVDVRARAIR